MAVDFPKAKLSELLTVLTAGSRPPGGAPDAKRGIPSLGGENVHVDGRLLLKDVKRVPESFFRSMPRGHLVAGDVLINKDGAQTGKVGIYRGEFSEACINEHLFQLRGNPELADQGFLYWSLLGPKAQAQIRRCITGSAQPGLSQGFVHSVQIGAASLPEQRRIAEILDTLDEAIRRTEHVIAKLQQMKQGLLRDLLTRGIDANGELRDRERQPEQFKDSPFGQIPKVWDVLPVEGLLAAVDPAMRSGPFGSALLKHELVARGVPLLGIDNVHTERFVADYSRFVSPQKAVALSRYLVRPRDVMITIMGTVGRCALAPDTIGDALSSKHVWTLTFDQELYLPYLVCLQFNHAPWVRRHFGRDEQGGIMSAIRSETLRTTLLPVPPREEQSAIESVFKALERRIEGEAQGATKLRTLKQGLMDDLLTGHVRVTVPDEAA